MAVTDRESHNTIYLDSVKGVKPINNYVLCKKVTSNVGSKTGVGLIKSTEAYHRDQFLVQNVDRVYTVVAVPSYLTDKIGLWHTDIDVNVGDTVWAKPVNALESTVVKVEFGDEMGEYRFINYHSLLVAKRACDGEYSQIDKKSNFILDNDILYCVIPLNGYILFDEVYKSNNANIVSLKKERDYLYGTIRFIGNPVDYYIDKVNHDDDKGVNVKIGDKVMFVGEQRGIALEHDMYLSFYGNRKYFCLQRWVIASIES